MLYCMLFTYVKDIYKFYVKGEKVMNEVFCVYNEKKMNSC